MTLTWQSVIEPDDTSAEPSDDEAKEPRLFIVDGIQETATVKRRPTVLEVVLKPEVFVEGSKEYVYEEIGYDKGELAFGNEIRILNSGLFLPILGSRTES